MNFKSLAIESLQSLRSNILRSILTVAGIVVGIFAVTAMLALGEGLSNNIIDRFSSFSTGDVSVSGELTIHDITWINERPYTEHILASQTLNVAVSSGGSSFNPTVTIYYGDVEELVKPVLSDGNFFDFYDIDYHERVAIIDTRFAESVLEETGADPRDSSLILGGQVFSIIGIIESNDFGFGRQSDGKVYIPYRTSLETLGGTSYFETLGVGLVDQSYYEVVAQDILGSLNLSRGLDSDSDELFSVSSAQTAIENAQETTQMLSLFLGIIGGITLFVGGIGTMNMMLTSVTERTKEIGLRKAIGARNRDILQQILFETVVVTLVGGAVGILLASIGSQVANSLLSENQMIQVVMSWRVIGLSVFVSIIVGLVFGYYPARNAAKLQPADALRAD